MSKIKVLCVDDSALIREILTEMINSQHDMEVVAVAPDPIKARELIKQYNPDVITLDVEMPKMDGIDFLERLMRLRPMPVVMISSLTQKGSDITLRALELGAIDFVAKPQTGIRSTMSEYTEMITDKIRWASRSKPRKPSTKVKKQPAILAPLMTSEKLLIIGASTGGTEAIREILERMPLDCPGILIAQHMPGGFTKSFADRLNKICNITVKEAEDGERVLPGHAYIAPGTHHLKLIKSGANYICRLDDGEPVNRHKPSCDVLFESSALTAGKNAIGIILTGMGKDGAVGLLKMRESGSHTISQDEKTSVVYGMPKEAAEIGASVEILPLDSIAEHAMKKLDAMGRSIRI